MLSCEQHPYIRYLQFKREIQQTVIRALKLGLEQQCKCETCSLPQMCGVSESTTANRKDRIRFPLC